MKKINVCLIFLALIFIGALGTQTSLARNTSIEKTPDVKQLTKIINKLVKYPNFTLNDKEEGGEIYVTFMLTNDGKIKIGKVTAPSQRLEEYVKENLSDVIANNVIHSYNQKYKVKIRFENT